ncbi:MAG: hypothetical protein U1A77_21870 [Pirellulales bacterium]
MMDDRLHRQLRKVAGRLFVQRVIHGLTGVWGVGALLALGFVWAWFRQGSLSLWVAPLLLAAAILLAIAVVIGITLRRLPMVEVAKRIEEGFPELRGGLLTAMEQKPESPGKRLGYLQTAVVREVLQHAGRHPWTELLSSRQRFIALFSNIMAFGLFAVSLAGVALLASQSPVPNSVTTTPASTRQTGSETVIEVEPGDIEVERDEGLSILARVHGAVPLSATLLRRPLTTDLPPASDAPPNSPTTEASSLENIDFSPIAMTSSLQEPVFGARISRVEAPFEYRVEIEGASSPPYRVKVFERPKLERADAHLVYPAYTRLENRTLKDVRVVSAVEGTRVTLRCKLNKSVASATLMPATGDAADASPIRLTAATGVGHWVEATLECSVSRRLQLELVDAEGRKSAKSEQFRIQVTKNQFAAIKPIFPARDLEVSALEELHLTASVVDDFGVQRFGLAYSLGEADPVEVVLGENLEAKKRSEQQHVVRLEELNAEPDQLLAYHWWAEDLDASGNVRRIEGDLYFAEVRPYEEIFRQGQSETREQQRQRQQDQQNGQQGEGGNAADAQELAKLQKEIVNATWKLTRTADDATSASESSRKELVEKLTADVSQVKLSQESALERAVALGERLTDERSQEHLAAVVKHMQAAIDSLSGAEGRPHRETLEPALRSERAAYQSLLKLRAREHEVVRQQQQQQQRSQQQRSSSSSRSQQQEQQLQNLEMREEENRYETQSEAREREEESQQDRENRQVLNRLRELARRQHDLNERLKELQTALDEAATEEKKEEIRRQLQRLQDEQREILRDTDELQTRMEQPENQERMTEQRQQLEETRDQVRRSSEALEQQQVSRAAAAGARAEEQFDELREEFRRRASQRFGEEMRQMRNSARELDQKQQELAERLNEQPPMPDPKKTPRALEEPQDTRKEEVAERVTQQRRRLEQLQEAMRETIERAEATEPLLTERLYESARDLRDRSIERSLEEVDRATRFDRPMDARQANEAASERTRRLREGIDRAAEGVLGDESEALRRARDELRNLSRELGEELRRETGEGDESQNEQQQPGQQQPGQQQPGQQQPGQQQPGQQQPGQQQPGQQQPGQQQPGQQQPGQQQPGGRQQSSERSRERGAPSLGADEETANEGRFVPRSGGGDPLTGEGFRRWSDRLRDVEEMVDNPDLSAEASRIRQRARELRAEFKRHSKPPNWELVRGQLAAPLAELEQRVSEELSRRESKKALVPLDRDPVPPEYSEKLRKYYERLGSGR